MKKIGLIIGHTEGSQGAKSYNGISEYKYNSKVAEICKKELTDKYDCEVTIFNRNKGYDYINAMLGGVEFTIELHFNAFSKPAFGLEMLVLDESPEECHKIADVITDILATNYKMKERGNDGLKKLGRYERGAWCLRSVNVKHKMLIEPCFANFKTKDSEQFFEPGCADIYGKKLASAIATALSLKPFTVNKNEDTISELRLTLEHALKIIDYIDKD